ncbi:hypothetical protein OG930_38505 [Streptomyces sp. NBC_01799]|uniref:hypothetical protein n=1 Tax=Streptomyces sp. NBC_01800 TaxID=2975945 RepID=UPI002DD91511|nr:hypothetical protein [Streptomyces sp. NBC_01800]WSA72457.1 hypothetical protein OIE65_39130 [Streptomyces sp. NBC_01800]WSA80981.1 hypothetical protein OG930_38505 [Streptomyces sp. NBC_01799]
MTTPTATHSDDGFAYPLARASEGLFQTPRPEAIPAILVDSHTMHGDYGVDQPLGDAVAIGSHVLPNRLGIGLGDDATLDRLDDAARAWALCTQARRER